MPESEPYQPIYTPTPEEGRLSLLAAGGDFSPGLYWTVLPTPSTDLARVFELARQGYFKVEKQVMLRHASLTWLLVKMPMGYAGEVGEKIADAAHWYRAEDPNVSPHTTTPELEDEEKDPVLDPIAETIEEKVTEAKKILDKIGKGIGAVAGVALVGFLIYGIVKLAKDNQS